MAGEFGEVEAREQRLRALAARAQRQALELDAEHDVFGDGTPRQQQVLLQHERDVGVRTFDALAVDESRTLARRRQSRSDVEQRAFAATARPDQRRHLPVADRKAHLLDRREKLFAVAPRKTHRDIAVFEAHGIGHRQKLDRKRAGIRSAHFAARGRLSIVVTSRSPDRWSRPHFSPPDLHRKGDIHVLQM